MDDPRQQIVDQLTEIAWILDHKQWDRLGEIFTEDAEGYGHQGLPAITANTIRYLGRCGPTQAPDRQPPHSPRRRPGHLLELHPGHPLLRARPPGAALGLRRDLR